MRGLSAKTGYKGIAVMVNPSLKHSMVQRFKNFFKGCVNNAMVSLFLVIFIGLLGIINTSMASQVIPIQIGDWYLEPTIDITLGRTDSEFFRDNVPTKDTYTQINPKVILSNKTKEREVFFSYELDAVQFNENSEGDYESSFLEGEYRRSISSHSDLSLRGEYKENSLTNGVRSELQVINPIDENQRIDVDAKEVVLTYQFYGEKRQGAGHLFEASLASGERDFSSSEVDVENRDLDYSKLEAKWRYRWAKGNSVFANFNATDFEYKNQNTQANDQFDNQETEFIVGFEWRARRNISGEIGVGVIRKKFDNIDVDVEIPSFYGELEIMPTALDTFRLEAQRRSVEQAGTGAFQDYREIELSWTRRVSRRWSFDAYVGGGDVDYEDSTREDDFFRYGLIFEYRLSRVADLIFGYKYYDDDSNEDRFDYNGNNLFITLSTGL